MALTKNKGPLLYFSKFGGEQPIPPEFIAKMNRAEEIQAVPNDVTPEALSDTIVESRVETNRTDERVRHTIKKDAGNITLTDKLQDKDGQVVTRTRVLYPVGTTATAATALMQVEVHSLGNGWAIEERSVVSTVFPGSVAEARQTGSYPAEFLSNNAILSTTALISSGTTATAPTLGTGGTGVVSGTAMRIDAFKIKTESTSLSGGVSTVKSEGALDEGLPVTITTSLISDSTSVPSSGSLLTVLQTQQLQGNGYAVKKVGVVSSYPTRYGQNYNPKLNLVVPWTESTIAPGATGTAKTDINPVDYAKQRNRTYGSVTAAYDAVFFSGVGNTVVDLPDVLTGLSVVYNSAFGTGLSDYPASQQSGAVVGGGSLTTNPSNTVKASASISPDLVYTITKYGGLKVPCVHYYFYLTGALTIANVITRLATGGVTALQLPVFKTTGQTFVLSGSQVEVSSTAKTSVTTSFDTNSAGAVTRSAFSTEWGNDYSENVATSVKSVMLPPTLHGLFTLTASASATATATATAPFYGHAGVVPVTAIPNAPAARTKTASGSVFPTSFAATNPTTIPTSGKYIVDVSSEIGEYGYMLVHAVVVDFSVYA